MKAYHIIRIWVAIKLPKLRKYLLAEKEQERLIMAELRSLALFFGFNTSEMSDEEIKEGISFAAKEMSKAGLTASEACEALLKYSSFT